MKTLFTLGIAAAVSLAGIQTASAGRKMVMLIDATGSMTIPRTAGGATGTRFDAARTAAAVRLRQAAMETEGLDGAAVFVFFGTGIVAKTSGFVDPFVAATAAEATTVTLEDTPLAGSLCDAIDFFAANTPTSDTRLLEVKTDGEENNTPLTAPCGGPPSVRGSPFDAGSWQNKVLAKALANRVIINPTLFTAGEVGFAASAPVTATRDAPRRSLGIAAVPGTIPDDEFFEALAVETGGVFELFRDDEVIPVFGDLDGNACTDLGDALLIVRNFTTNIPPDKARFDLNNDAVIGFSDYFLARINVTPACAAPDPRVKVTPVVCRGSNRIVLDGRAIEDAGIAIEVRGSCRITIRNSRIVAGRSAITIRGSAAITIDNSIIAGEHALIVLNGSATLSARNTFFKGAKEIFGAFAYQDRGGNTWE